MNNLMLNNLKSKYDKESPVKCLIKKKYFSVLSSYYTFRFPGDKIISILLQTYCLFYMDMWTLSLLNTAISSLI